MCRGFWPHLFVPYATTHLIFDDCSDGYWSEVLHEEDALDHLYPWSCELHRNHSMDVVHCSAVHRWNFS